MYCANCGTSNPDTASICANCGRSLAATPPASPGGYTPIASPASSPDASGGSYTPPTAPGGYTPPPPPSSFGGGGYTPGTGAPGSIPNYLVQAILVTLCCCLPGGIVAIVFAAQVNSKLAAGDVAGAMEASRKAKQWCWISFAVGLVLIVISMLVNGAAMFQAFRESGIH